MCVLVFWEAREQGRAKEGLVGIEVRLPGYTQLDEETWHDQQKDKCMPIAYVYIVREG